MKKALLIILVLTAAVGVALYVRKRLQASKAAAQVSVTPPTTTGGTAAKHGPGLPDFSDVTENRP